MTGTKELELSLRTRLDRYTLRITIGPVLQENKVEVKKMGK